MAAAVTSTVPPAPIAMGRVAPSLVELPPRSQDRDSRNGGDHEARAPLASRHPHDDRPPARTRHRRPSQPTRRRLALALRNSPAGSTDREPYHRNHLNRCLADNRRIDRHNRDSPVLAAFSATGGQPRLVRHHGAPSTRRLRRSNDLLQPGQDPHRPVDISSTVRRTSPTVVPSRQQHRRLHSHPNHTHVRVLGKGCRCTPRYKPPPSCHSRRHTPTALQPHQGAPKRTRH
jgi:hypothetical protein